MEVHTAIHADRAALMAGAADSLVDAAKESIAERGRWMWALSGGSTPETVYQLLAAEPYRSQINWNRVHVFWGDERCVPPEHKDSNYGMARRALLDHVPLPPENIRRIRGELSPQEAADDYIEQLRRAFGLGRMEMPVFDTVLLGLGADGHTASLFPDTEILRRTDVPVAVARVAKLDANRISLTYPAINAAREILFLVSGADKAPVVQAILGGKGEQYPAAAIRNAAWLLDAEAAAGIGS